nr:hypothetical protein [Tanacetum cinerariifolium]GEY33474.1 hypothetical protein [Tanacetum cinerariifolium]
MGDEHLDTIPETESEEVKKSSVEDLVPISSESEDTSGNDSNCVLPLCDDFSPINVFKEKYVTFSNPLFNSNNNFTSSDDESLSDEDFSKDNIKIYSNPLFEFDEEYISSDVNPLFYEDEYFTLGDDVELLLHRDPSTPMMSVVSILEGFTDEPPLEENDDLFDLESKENKWKKILYIDDLMSEDKIFNPGIHDQIFSPTYVESPFLLSSRSKDTIFDPDIFAVHFLASDCSDFEDSRARGFVHRPLELLSLAYGNSIF